MLVTKKQAIEDLKKLTSPDRVLTDEASLKFGEGYNLSYAKYFDLYPNPLPVAIVNAVSTAEISAVLKYCNKNDIYVQPRTGNSGGEALNEIYNDSTIVLDGSMMDEIIKIDEYNMTVTAQCGVPLERLENLLREKGLTTGHGPQSLPMADMGGLAATRSIGQFSTYYGGIEDLLTGLEAVLPNGEIIRIRNVPRRSAGPDLRQIFIGSEGAFAYITEVSVKIFKYYPDDMWMGGYKMKNMKEGLHALRDIITAGWRPSVVRLYDKSDMDHNFGSVKMKDDEAFMFFVTEGPADLARVTGENIHKMALERGGEFIGDEAVKHWMEHRNDLCKKYGDPVTAAKRRETHLMYFTTEISASWSDIEKIYDDVMETVPKEIPNLVMLGGHVSHSYQNGTNIYFVHTLKMSSPEAADAEHRATIDSICRCVLKQPTGGCVHHHGMGKRRVKFAKAEHGTSYPLIIGLKDIIDPRYIMSPGVLVRERSDSSLQSLLNFEAVNENIPED